MNRSGEPNGQERAYRMSSIINTNTLRHELARIVERVRKGEDFTVFHRSRPVFRIVPVNGAVEFENIEDDPLYKAEAVGRSKDGLTAADHDRILYGESNE